MTTNITTSSSKTSGDTVLRQQRHERGFVIIDNDVADDMRLSFAARGIHHYMLTRPADWRFSADRIARASSGEGRQRVQKALRELEAAGYLRRDVVSGYGGKLSTVVTVSDRSIPEWSQLGAERITKRSSAAQHREQPAETNVSAAHTEGRFSTSGENTPKTHPDLPAETNVFPVRTEGQSPAPGDRTPVNGQSHLIPIPNTVIQEGSVGETSTHTPHGRTAREAHIDDDAPAVEVDTVGVCVENSEDQNLDTDDHADATHEAVAILRKCVHPTAAKRLGEKQANDLAAITARILLAGHSADAVCGRINGITRVDTHSPYKCLLPVLEAMATETPQKPVSNDSVSVKAPAKRSCRADCVDGQIRCSADCPSDCKSTHAPLGPSCPQCRSMNHETTIDETNTAAKQLVDAILDSHDVPMTRRAAPGALHSAHRCAQSLLNLGMSTDDVIGYVASQGSLSEVGAPVRVLAEWLYAGKK